MKKGILFVLLASLLILTACSKGNTETTPRSQETTPRSQETTPLSQEVAPLSQDEINSLQSIGEINYML